jgi:hypothetical protein
MSDPIVPLDPEQVTTQEQRAVKENFIVRDLVAVDEMANVLTGGLPDETISSRLARDAEKGDEVGKVGSEILDVFQPDHGAKAQAGDAARATQVLTTEEDSGDLK